MTEEPRAVKGKAGNVSPDTNLTPPAPERTANLDLAIHSSHSPEKVQIASWKK